MAGKLKISAQAEAVRQFFMSCEKDAKQLKTCWFCGSQWPTMKLANQGYLSGNHSADCPFEKLAVATEQCIVVRNDDKHTTESAERTLLEKIDELFLSMNKDITPHCPFPICGYPYEQKHRMQCPFSSLRAARARAVQAVK